MSSEEWTTAEHVEHYLERRRLFPHHAEGEGVLLELLPSDIRRVLDLGRGDGRVLSSVLEGRPGARGVGVDFSEPMLALARERFSGDERVAVVDHNLSTPLPELGRFDVV